MEESIFRSWDKKPDEPDIWYKIFVDYYLPLGSRRSLRTAFEFYLRVEQPLQYRELDPDNLAKVPAHWHEMATQFEWAKRAIEYDESKIPDFAEIYVNQVLEYLRTHALVAASSLVRALENDRTRVQAANSILDRAGVPTVSEINLRTGINITADDMAEAANKVQEWKQTKQSQSG